MLTADQVSFFHAFGFVVVDDLVARPVLADLTTEVSAALGQAFGEDPQTQLRDYVAGRGGPRAGAVLGQYLPVMAPTTPTSLSLVESPELVGTAHQLLDTTAPIPKPAKAVRYVSPSGWHRDGDREPGAVKTIFYLESAADITFELVPASHLEPVAQAVRQLLGERGDREPAGLALPTVTVALKPHQALVFDVALWHRNPSSDERTQWSVTYLSGPRDAEELRLTVKSLGSFFGKHPAYDHAAFPFFPATWLDGSSDADLARNLRRTGVLREFVGRYAEFL